MDALKQAAKLLACAAHAAYLATPRGDIPEGSSKNFAPVVGTILAAKVGSDFLVR